MKDIQESPERIPFIELNHDLKKRINQKIWDKMKGVVESSQFILGEPVAEFELAFAKEIGSKHAVAVNSGLDALILGMRALGVKEGDEVITVPNSFIASAAAISLIGATPVFVDVLDDYNINPQEISGVVSPKTRGILPVHLTGNPCRMEELMKVAEKHQLWVLEDAAQAVGATYHGKKVGTFGKVGAFSLHPLKNLHVWGDGGIITTDDDKIALNLRQQRNHGLKNRDEADFYSFNSRLDTLQAVVAKEYLALLPEVTSRRIANAQRYMSRLGELDGYVKLPVVADNTQNVFHVFQVRAKRRDDLKKYLESFGVETKVHYPIPIHWQKASEYLGYSKGDFPVTDRLAGEILSLPVRENLSLEQVDYISDLVIKFYQS